MTLSAKIPDLGKSYIGTEKYLVSDCARKAEADNYGCRDKSYYIQTTVGSRIWFISSGVAWFPVDEPGAMPPSATPPAALTTFSVTPDD